MAPNQRKSSRDRPRRKEEITEGYHVQKATTYEPWKETKDRIGLLQLNNSEFVELLLTVSLSASRRGVFVLLHEFLQEQNYTEATIKIQISRYFYYQREDEYSLVIELTNFALLLLWRA